MPSIQTIAITVAALSLYFYLTSYKGLIILAVLLTILMGLIYFKQNMLLYMPGKLSHNLQLFQVSQNLPLKTQKVIVTPPKEI